MTWTDKDRAASIRKRANPKEPAAFKIDPETAAVWWKMSARDGRARRNYKTIAGMLGNG